MRPPAAPPHPRHGLLQAEAKAEVKAKAPETPAEAKADSSQAGGLLGFKGCWFILTGRWPWKSKPAKECVTTHLPNGLAPKMDGAHISSEESSNAPV